MSLAIAEIEREPRVLDLELANRLDFALPREIRRLISRNREELEQYGEVVFRSAQSNSKGGRPTKECWLNEGQALLLCMFSQTNRAAQVRKELIDTFMEWRHKTVAVKKHNRRPPARREPVSLFHFHMTGTKNGQKGFLVNGFIPLDMGWELFAAMSNIPNSWDRMGAYEGSTRLTLLD